MPKVSVIIPIYNTEKFLSQALESCVNQTLADIEIICIEDCSTDSSPQILEEFAQKDSRIKILKPDERITTGKARNWALDVAQGDYIIFLDSDDWFELNACELAYNQISKNQNDMVFFEQYLYYERKNMKKVYGRLSLFTQEEINTPNLRINELSDDVFKNGEGPACRIYRREFLLKNKIYFTDTVSVEDAPFTLKAIFLAETVSVLPQALYYYRKYMAVAPSRVVDRWYDFFENWRKVYEIFLEIGQDEYFEKYLIPKIVRFLINRYPSYKRNKDLAPKVYNEIREFIKLISTSYDLEKYPVIPRWNLLLIQSISNHVLYNFLINCYSVTIHNGHKLINFCGIRIRIKLKRKVKNA